MTSTKQLRTVRVAIKWGNKPPDKLINPSQITVNPSIHIRHLAVTNWMDGASNDGSDQFNVPLTTAALSHIEILPPSPNGSGGQATLPTIITIRSHLPASPSQYNQDTHSIIDRWELRESAQTIHPAFEELNSQRTNAGSQLGVGQVSLRHVSCLTVVYRTHLR